MINNGSLKILLLTLFISFPTYIFAQKYDFDYLLEWVTEEGWRGAGSRNMVLINSKNAHYDLNIYTDYQTNTQKAKIWDNENGISHYYDVVIKGSENTVFKFVYTGSVKIGEIKFRSVPMEMKNTGGDQYAIITYAGKKRKRPQYRFEFTLENSTDDLFSFSIEGINTAEVVSLIKSAFPENQEFAITEYKTIYPSGSVEHMKLIQKQKLNLQLNITPSQIKFLPKN